MTIGTEDFGLDSSMSASQESLIGDEFDFDYSYERVRYTSISTLIASIIIVDTKTFLTKNSTLITHSYL